MKFPLLTNDKGSFLELAHESDVKFGQLSLLTVYPGCERGGHYHTHKEEWFCCIRGMCRIDMINVNDDTRREVVLDSEHKEFILVKPYESHIVINLSEYNECELLVIISEEYDPKNPDTIKYGG